MQKEFVFREFTAYYSISPFLLVIEPELCVLNRKATWSREKQLILPLDGQIKSFLLLFYGFIWWVVLAAKQAQRKVHSHTGFSASAAFCAAEDCSRALSACLGLVLTQKQQLNNGHAFLLIKELNFLLAVVPGTCWIQFAEHSQAWKWHSWRFFPPLVSLQVECFQRLRL